MPDVYLHPYLLQVELVDFGATREYSKEFIDDWLHLLQSAASDDKQSCVEWSRKVGYLTGQEDEVFKSCMDTAIFPLTCLPQGHG